MSNKANQRTVLHDIRYIDVIQGKIVHNQTIVIEKQEITWIGESANYQKNQGDQIVPIPPTCIVVPGLLDCHVHLESMPVSNYEQEYVRTKTNTYSYYALKNALLHLIAGFTTLRDCGGLNYGSSLRTIFETEFLPGPRLLVAQRPIVQYGNQEFVGPEELYYNPKYAETLSGKDGVIHAVRDRIKTGSDFIKITTSGGVLHGQGSQLNRHFFTEEELEALVCEAHRMGIHVASHSHGDAGIYSATKAGVDTIEHGSFISEESMKLMVENGNYLVPTQTSAFIDKPELMKNLPPEVVTKTTAVDTAMFENHKIAFEKGVKIALGTDAGVPGNPHGTSARELTSMVEKIGMTTIQAIQSATIEAAKAIKINSFVGSIEIGKKADLTIIQGNIIENIKLLEDKSNIKLVMKNGKILVSNGRLENFL